MTGTPIPGQLVHARHPLPTGPVTRTRRSTNRLRLIADRHEALSDERIHQAHHAAEQAFAESFKAKLAKYQAEAKVHPGGIIAPPSPTHRVAGPRPAYIAKLRRTRTRPWPRWEWAVYRKGDTGVLTITNEDAVDGTLVASGASTRWSRARDAMYTALDRERAAATRGPR